MIRQQVKPKCAYFDRSVLASILSPPEVTHSLLTNILMSSVFLGLFLDLWQQGALPPHTLGLSPVGISSAVGKPAPELLLFQADATPSLFTLRQSLLRLPSLPSANPH